MNRHRSLLPALKSTLSWHLRKERNIPNLPLNVLTDRRLNDRRRGEQGPQDRGFRLRAVAKEAEFGVYDLDYPAGNIYCSPELKAIAGLPQDSQDDLSPDQLLQLVHPEDRERISRRIGSAVDPAGNGRFEDEMRLVHGNGAIRWIKVRGRAFFSADDSPKLLGASGIVIDISERKAAEKTLRERAEELRLALRVGNSGTFQWDPRSHEHRWCEEMLALYGLKRKEFGGRDEDWLDCLLPEDRQAAMEAVERSLTSGEYFSSFRIRRRSDGEIRWVTGRGQVSFDADGTPVRMVGINVDVTAQKQIEAEREENRTRLEAILNSLSEGVVIFDLTGQVLNMNPAALRLLRYGSMAEARRRLPEFAESFELLSLEGRSLSLGEWPIGRVIRGESFNDYEIQVRRIDDGTTTILSHNGTTVQDGSGQAILGVLTLWDVTDRKQTEQALRRKQQRLAGLVGAAMDAIISVDAQQRIVLFNPAAEALFGYPAGEAQGKPIDMLIPERFRASHRDQVNRFFTEGTTARKMGQLQHLWGLRADGDEFPLEASISKVDVGGTWLATVILRDITERFQAEQALRKSQEQLAQALQAGLSGAFDCDTQTGENHWSDELLALYGLQREDYGGRAEDWLARLHPDDRPAAEAAVQHAFETGVFKLEFRIRRGDNGDIRWMEGRGKAFFDDQGLPRRMVGIHMDITEKKQLEQALQRANETLEQRVRERTAELGRSNDELLKRNDELQRFAYIASHDLQTPLRAITSCSQMLQRDYKEHLDERANNLIHRVVGATHRMQTLIHDLLAYTRIASQARPFQPVNFRQIFKTVQTTLADTIQETGAEVCCADLPTVLGDPSQLTELLQHLIGNGIKYHGADPPRVHVSAVRQDGSWLFSVRDNGIGIPPDQLEAVFEIFRRLHTQHAYPGTGIGLAVCRRVVERHGGRIWAESEPGQGSVFHFTLPNPSNEVSP